MKAVVIQGPGDARVTERPKPKLRDGYVLVKVKVVAINPTDWKHVDRMASPGALVGCDYSGVVEEVGKDVTKFKKGERIAGFVHGGNHVQHEDGAFAEYIVAKADIQIRLPNYLSFEKAATFGVASMTVGQGLYQKMGLAWPSKPSTEGETILIYGGSGGMGTYGIQFAKLSGYKVITTCSPRNFDLVKGLGAIEAFDYKDPDCAKKIREYTHDNLKLCWDTISLPATAKLCAEALSSKGEGCKYGAILNIYCPRPEVKSTWTIAYTAVGESFEFGPLGTMPASKEDFEYMKAWALEWEKAFEEKTVQASEPKVGPDGLKGVIQGMDDVKNDRNSGTRLAYRVEETP